MTNADNFMNFATRLYELDLPFTLEGGATEGGWASATVACFELGDYERAIALAKERNLELAPSEERVKLIFRP